MKIQKIIPFGVAIACLPTITSCSTSAFDTFINNLKNNENSIVKAKKIKHLDGSVSKDNQYYNVYPFNNKMLEFIVEDRQSYSVEDCNKLLNYFNDNLFQINLISNKGVLFAGAATPSRAGTNYESVWVRDTMWIYKMYNSFSTKNPEYTNIAKLILLGMVKYLHTNDQMNRMSNAINDPSLVLRDDDIGKMNAVHIRFSPYTLDDLYVDGKPEIWNHKQNDALGFFLLELFDAINNNLLSISDLGDEFDLIPYMISYLNALNYWTMEDAGAWEENNAVRASSIGLITSAYEKFVSLYESNTNFKTKYDKIIKTKLELQKNGNIDAIKNAIVQSYVLLHESIEKGGECITYDVNDKRYRKADAALLNLIYPCELSELTFNEYNSIYDVVVKDLSTDYGVKRYLKDSYQSGNYWFDFTNNVDSSKSRDDYFIKGSEASWFFNSWLSIIDNIMLKKYGSEMTTEQTLYYKDQVIVNINKSLAQVSSSDYYVADGTKCDKEKLPESINVIVDKDNNWYYLPSPINPLNWSISSIGLAIQKLME